MAKPPGKGGLPSPKRGAFPTPKDVLDSAPRYVPQEQADDPPEGVQQKRASKTDMRRRSANSEKKES